MDDFISHGTAEIFLLCPQRERLGVDIAFIFLYGVVMLSLQREACAQSRVLGRRVYRAHFGFLHRPLKKHPVVAVVSSSCSCGNEPRCFGAQNHIRLGLGFSLFLEVKPLKDRLRISPLLWVLFNYRLCWDLIKHLVFLLVYDCATFCVVVIFSV